MSSQKRVVVIGGGFCGAMVARKLQKSFEVTLVDTKEYFEYTPGILRTIVHPNHIAKIQSRHETYLPDATIVTGEVSRISKDAAFIGSKKFPFDYLVIAAGSRYTPPIKDTSAFLATRAETLSNEFHKVHHAKHVLLIGGGLVGVELAAEIIEKYPKKKITIVHSRPTLIDRNHPGSISYSQEFLLKRGVEIICGERLKGKKSDAYVTDTGRSIAADAAVVCGGITPNNEVIKKKAMPVCNEFLQVTGKQNVFIGGDVAGISEEKTAQAAEKHGAIIAYNICALETNVSLKSYVPKRRPMVISLGEKRGIFEGKRLVLTGRIPAILKSFIEWKTMRKYR